MSAAVDAFVAYQFLKLLTKPWEDTDAYRLGIIDASGEVLRKRKSLKTREEKKAYTIFHTLVWNIKRLLEKLPPGRTRIGSFAAGLWMLKEHLDMEPDTLTKAFIRFLEENYPEIETSYSEVGIISEMHNITDTLLPGRYRVLHDIDHDFGRISSGNIFNIRKPVAPIGEMAGENIFRVAHPDTPDGILVTADDLERI